jgi:integrase
VILMQEQRSGGARPRRTRGTGSLEVRPTAAGGRVWYGRWWVGGKLLRRRIAEVREPGARFGLTKTQAEARLRELMVAEKARPRLEERLTVEQAVTRYVDHVEQTRGRKATTVQDYRAIGKQLSTFFAGKSLEKVEPCDIEAYMRAKAAQKLSPKTIANHVTFLHGVFAHGEKQGWATRNPVALVDRPRASGANPDIRFLDTEELEALLRAVPDDDLGRVERALYLTAAMAGLRQGELVGLRWRDVDWTASVIRVRQSFTRGSWTTPKSRRSARAVPMSTRLAGELERLFQTSRFQKDDDLVFAHPTLGTVLDASKLRKRFTTALEIAKVRRVRFHDLRHTYGTRMAAAGAPMRSLMEWMGHSNLTTTLIYADYAPDPSQGARFAELAFGTAAPAGAEVTTKVTN